MLVGKRFSFEEEMPLSSNQNKQSFCYKRQIKPGEKIESLSEIYKRQIQQNAAQLSKQHPKVPLPEIIRLLEDFENNAEMVNDIIIKETPKQQKKLLKPRTQPNDPVSIFRKQLASTLIMRLQRVQDMNLAQNTIEQCLDEVEKKAIEKNQAEAEKLKSDKEIFKQAFLKLDRRYTKLKMEFDEVSKIFEAKQNENEQLSLQLQKEKEQNKTLSLYLSCALQQQNNSVYNNDVF